jgi:cell division protein FtsW
MVFSSSYLYSKEIFGSSITFFSKQFLFLLIGVVLCFIVSKFNPLKLIKFAPWFHSFSTLLLMMTLLPEFGESVNGASRWLALGGFRFQPAEIMKASFILMALKFLETEKTHQLKQTLFYVCALVLPMIVFLMQPDFGSFSICGAIILMTFFLSSLSRKIFYPMLGTLLIGAVCLVYFAPYRMQRILVYLDPWKDPKNAGFQIIQSYLAFSNGHWFGAGLGNSSEKLFYLPEAHNDFIFSVLGEELGFIGVLLMITLFATFLISGIKLSLQASSRERIILASSIILCISLQIFLNLGVVLGLLPTKGLNLPFVSYGGSSLLGNFLLIGIFIACVKHKKINISKTQSTTRPTHSYNYSSYATGHNRFSGGRLPK